MVIPVLETLSSRFKSPYYGSFALAWIVSAWQPLYVTFVMSTDELPFQPGTALRYPDKLTYIWTIPTLTWCRLFWLPMLCGLLTPMAIQILEGAVAFSRVKVEQFWGFVGREWLGEVHTPPAEYNRVVSALDLMTRERDQFAAQVSQYRDLAEKAEAERTTHQRDADHQAREAKKSSDELESVRTAYANQGKELREANEVLRLNRVLTEQRGLLDQLIESDLASIQGELRKLSEYDPRWTSAIAVLESIRGRWRTMPLLATESTPTKQ